MAPSIWWLLLLTLGTGASEPTPTPTPVAQFRASELLHRVQLDACRNSSTGEEGYCMFAMDCRRVQGRHVAVCMKEFYYGSCCVLHPEEGPSHPLEDLPRVPIADINAIDSSPLDFSLWPDLPYSTGIEEFFQPMIRPPLLDYGGIEEGSLQDPSSPKPATETINNKIPNITIIYAVAANETENPTIVTTESSSNSSLISVSSETSFGSSPTTSTTISPSSMFVPINVITAEISSTTTVSNVMVPLLTNKPEPPLELVKTAFKFPDALIAALSPSISVNRSKESEICGKPVYRWPKIVSGENARPGQWPWMMSLQERTRRGYFHKCGASILNQEWALTAAHCLNNVPQESLLIKYGGIDFASADDKFYESKVLSYPHPKFSLQTQQYDIALLKLLSPINYQSNALPICLPDRGMVFDYEQSIVAGWGKLSERGIVPTKLQYVGVPIINNTDCQSVYKSINKHIDNDVVCAGYPMGQKDSCEGDSGGPVMVFKRGRWVAAGVISWGVGCARANQPGVSTRVTEFLDWINSYITPGSR